MSGSHEDFSRDVHGKGPSDRSFGWVFTVFFLLLGISPLRHHLPVRIWWLAGAGAMLLVTLLKASLLHGPNRIWTKLGILLGKVMNPIVTALLFYLVFTPAAALMRLFGKDILSLRYAPEANTYWIARQDKGSESSMSNLF